MLVQQLVKKLGGAEGAGGGAAGGGVADAGGGAAGAGGGAADAGGAAIIEVNALLWGRFRIAAGAAPASFPFDVYECCITLMLDRVGGASEETRYSLLRLGGGWRDSPATLHAVRDASPVGEEWSVHDPLFCSAVDEVSGYKPIVELSFVAARRPMIHLANGFGLTVIITLMNLCAFGIGPLDVADRVQIPATVSLAIVALKLALQSQQPPSGRPNWLETFVNGAIAFTLVIMAAFSAPRHSAALLSRMGAATPTDATLAAAMVTLGGLLCACFVLAVMREHALGVHRTLGPALPLRPWRAKRDNPFRAAAIVRQ